MYLWSTIVHGAFFRSDGPTLVALRIDTTVAGIEIGTTDVGVFPVAFPTITSDRTPLGPVIGVDVSMPASTVRFLWLDAASAVVATLDMPAEGECAPVGVAGAGPQVLAFESNSGGTRTLSAGVSSSPGAVTGGARPLVNALDSDGYSPRGHAWESAPGTISIIYWRASAEVVTLCSAR